MPIEVSPRQVRIVEVLPRVPGPRGADGTDGADGTVWTHRGVWTSAANYIINDVVTYNGSTYLATQAHTNVAPAQNAFWTVVAAKGDPGATTWAGVTGKPTSFVGAAFHGANASLARPTGYSLVLWVGTAQPENAATDDLWLGATMQRYTGVAWAAV